MASSYLVLPPSPSKKYAGNDSIGKYDVVLVCSFIQKPFLRKLNWTEQNIYKQEFYPRSIGLQPAKGELLIYIIERFKRLRRD